MAILVVSLASEKAKNLRIGEKFEVTVPPSSIPAGAHYAEITEPLRSMAQKEGYKLLVNESQQNFTYYFRKL
jgi:hypothetical protein